MQKRRTVFQEKRNVLDTSISKEDMATLKELEKKYGIVWVKPRSNDPLRNLLFDTKAFVGLQGLMKKGTIKQQDLAVYSKACKLAAEMSGKILEMVDSNNKRFQDQRKKSLEKTQGSHAHERAPKPADVPGAGKETVVEESENATFE